MLHWVRLLQQWKSLNIFTADLSHLSFSQEEIMYCPRFDESILELLLTSPLFALANSLICSDP